MPDPLRLLSFIVFLVSECPKNKDDWIKASERLNCSVKNPNNTNLYHCVPNEDLTSLVEFCFTPKRIGVLGGNCVKLKASGILNPVSCLDFQEGCPDDFYFSDTIYRYPGCLEIDIQKRCFRSQRKCVLPSKNTSDQTTLDKSIIINTRIFSTPPPPPLISKENSEKTIIVILSLMTGLLLCGLCFVLSFKYRRKYACREDGDSTYISNTVEDEKESLLPTLKDIDLFLQAAKDGNKDEVKRQISRDILSKYDPEEKKTALHFAAKNGHIDVVSFLIQNQAEVNSQDVNDKTPLYCAVESGHNDVISVLIQNKADVNSQNVDGKTPLHCAVESNQFSVVEQILKCEDTDIDICDESGDSPLCKAVKGQFKDIVELLCLKGARVYLSRKKLSPIIAAVSQCGKKESIHTEITEILLQNSANVLNEKGETALHIAIQNDNLKCARLLIDITNINLCDDKKRSPLFLASRYGNQTIVNLLIERHADVNLVCETMNSPLHESIRNKNFGIAEILLKSEANPQAINKNKETPLNIACIQGDEALNFVQYLINKHNVTINADIEKQPISPLFSALQHEGDKIREFLVDNGAELEPEEIGKALIRGARHGYLGHVKYLINLRVDINSTEYSMYTAETPLHAAVKGNHREIVNLLLEKDASVNIPDDNGSIPLHDALDLAMAKMLINKDTDVNKEGWNKQTPLFNVSTPDVAKYLFEQGANIKAKDNTGWTPLHEATEKKRLGVVKFLIKQNADIGARDERQRGPLHVAAKCGNFEILKIMADNEVDVNISDVHGQTPLHEAAFSGNIPIVKYLIEKKANIKAKNKAGKTPADLTSNKDIEDLLKSSL